MRKPIVFGLAIALLATGALFAQGSGAKCYVEETNFDYGYLPAGQVVSHSYYLFNKGSDSLKILNVHPGCGCTKAPLTKDVVATGDSANVELIFNVARGSHGMVTKTATVTCNDPERSTFQLMFKGTTYTNPDSLLPLALSESAVMINSDSHDKSAKLTVKNLSHDPVRMRLVDAPSQYLSVDIPDAEIKPGKQKDITVEVAPGQSEQEFKKSFTFALDDQAETRYTVPVQLAKSVIMPQIQAAPTARVDAAKAEVSGKTK